MLRIAAASVLEALAVEDTTGIRGFLRSKTADAACFLELPLGRLSGMIRFTSCHRYSPFWTLTLAMLTGIQPSSCRDGQGGARQVHRSDRRQILVASREEAGAGHDLQKRKRRGRRLRNEFEKSIAASKRPRILLAIERTESTGAKETTSSTSGIDFQNAPSLAGVSTASRASGRPCLNARRARRLMTASPSWFSCCSRRTVWRSPCPSLHDVAGTSSSTANLDPRGSQSGANR